MAKFYKKKENLRISMVFLGGLKIFLNWLILSRASESCDSKISSKHWTAFIVWYKETKLYLSYRSFSETIASIEAIFLPHCLLRPFSSHHHPPTSSSILPPLALPSVSLNPLFFPLQHLCLLLSFIHLCQTFPFSLGPLNSLQI